MLLAFVAPLEAIAGLTAFGARDSGLAVGMLMLGWVRTSIAVAMLTASPGSRSSMLGQGGLRQ